MTTQQLRYFIMIVDSGSYMNAALELSISQSSISKQIQSLERELGVELFNRTSRKAMLTHEGKKLLPEARALLKKTEHFLDSAIKLRSDYSKHFTIATLPFIGYLGFYPSFSRFEITQPDYALTIIEGEEPQLMRRLLTNDFDIIITYEYEYRLSDSDQAFFPITDDEIVLIVHKDSPLAAKSNITLNHLSSTPLLLMESYTCISKFCTNYFQTYDFIPNIIFRGRPETIFGGVEAKKGAAMMTRKQAQCYSTTTAVTISFYPPIYVSIGAILNMNNRYRRELEYLIHLLNKKESEKP